MSVTVTFTRRMILGCFLLSLTAGTFGYLVGHGTATVNSVPLDAVKFCHAVTDAEINWLKRFIPGIPSDFNGTYRIYICRVA